MLRKRVFVLLLAALLLLPSALAMAEEEPVFDHTLNLNKRKPQINLELLAPEGYVNINGVVVRQDSVSKPRLNPGSVEDSQVSEFTLTATMMRQIAVAGLLNEKFGDLFDLSKVTITEDSFTYGDGDEMIDFSQSRYYVINGERFLIPAVHMSDLVGHEFKIDGLNRAPIIELKVEKAIQKQNSEYINDAYMEASQDGINADAEEVLN
ncbi:MAG: hypothetical protein Q4E65_01810 [Clostridia bacterium]|nr:hypothetical protein [Clostridia bacterium]